MYDTLNMLNFDVTKKCLVGEGWCPTFAKPQVIIFVILLCSPGCIPAECKLFVGIIFSIEIRCFCCFNFFFFFATDQGGFGTCINS